MHYHEALKQHPKGRCPFCHLKDEEVIQEYEHFLLIPTRAPYCEDHLLIVPKEHDAVLHELPQAWHAELYKIVDEWTEKLHTKHSDVSLLLRDGHVGGKSDKSQDHMHFHLIPDLPVGAQGTLNSADRTFFEEDEYFALTQSLKDKYL